MARLAWAEGAVRQADLRAEAEESAARAAYARTALPGLARLAARRASSGVRTRSPPPLGPAGIRDRDVVDLITF